VPHFLGDGLALDEDAEGRLGWRYENAAAKIADMTNAWDGTYDGVRAALQSARKALVAAYDSAENAALLPGAGTTKQLFGVFIECKSMGGNVGDVECAVPSGLGARGRVRRVAHSQKPHQTGAHCDVERFTLQSVLQPAASHADKTRGASPLGLYHWGCKPLGPVPLGVQAL